MKLVILALLVAAATATIAPLNFPVAEMQNIIAQAPRLQDYQACANFIASRSFDPTLMMKMGTCSATMSQAFGSRNVTWCDSDCGMLITQFFEMVFSPACADVIPMDAQTKAMVRGALGLLCLKEGNEYCMPHLYQLQTSYGAFNPWERADTQETLGNTICHPCIMKLYTQLQTTVFFDHLSQKALANALATFKLMCMKDGLQYCFPIVKDVFTRWTAAEASNPWQDSTWADKWKALATDVCEKPCFKSFLYGWTQLTDMTDLQIVAYKRAMNRLSVFCTKDRAAEYCVAKIVNAWMVNDMHTSQYCINPWAISNVDPSMYTLLQCNALCPANKLQKFFDDIGCCAGMLRNGVPPAYRNAVAAYVTNCGVNITADSCVPRLTEHRLARWRFANLKWSYANLYPEEVKAKIAADIAAWLKLAKEDLKVTLTQEGTTQGTADEFHLMAGAGTDATVAADCNQDDCNAADQNAGNTEFNKVNELPSDAAVNNDQPPSMGVQNDKPKGGDAATIATSFFVMVLALIVALF